MAERQQTYQLHGEDLYRSLRENIPRRQGGFLTRVHSNILYLLLQFVCVLV